MSGEEIRNYLEHSYDSWINTIDSADDRLLKMVNQPDARTGQKRWSFVNRSYNFDSAAGLVYDVDVTKPMGERVIIKLAQPQGHAGSFRHAFACHLPLGGRLSPVRICLQTRNASTKFRKTSESKAFSEIFGLRRM